MSKEFVKERVLKYLMEDLLVPQDMIDTNVPLSEFEEGADLLCGLETSCLITVPTPSGLNVFFIIIGIFLWHTG